MRVPQTDEKVPGSQMIPQVCKKLKQSCLDLHAKSYSGFDGREVVNAHTRVIVVDFSLYIFFFPNLILKGWTDRLTCTVCT